VWSQQSYLNSGVQRSVSTPLMGVALILVQPYQRSSSVHLKESDNVARRPERKALCRTHRWLSTEQLIVAPARSIVRKKYDPWSCGGGAISGFGASEQQTFSQNQSEEVCVQQREDQLQRKEHLQLARCLGACLSSNDSGSASSSFRQCGRHRRRWATAAVNASYQIHW